MGEYYALIPKSESLEHHGVKGMKWGVRKDKYKAHSLRARLASYNNKKVDDSFNKWNENADKRKVAINKGKARNEALIKYEQNKTSENKKAYKQANKDFKKALRANTTYRKGQVNKEVGSDLSKKYLKLARQTGNNKYYDKYNIEREKARRAPKVAENRSKLKASIKRALTISAKAALSATVSYAVYSAFRSMNTNIPTMDPDYLRKAARVSQYINY